MYYFIHIYKIMRKRIYSRNKKTRNKRKNLKNKTKKYGGEINLKEITGIMDKEKKPSILGKISDKLSKAKEDYSYGNLMKRSEEYKNDLKKAVEEEKKKKRRR